MVILLDTVNNNTTELSERVAMIKKFMRGFITQEVWN